MQFFVAPVMPGDAIQQNATDWLFQRKDVVKGYYTDKRAAQAHATELALKTPGQQFAVFEISEIFETLPPAKPKVIRKHYNDAGEIVVAT